MVEPIEHLLHLLLGSDEAPGAHELVEALSADSIGGRQAPLIEHALNRVVRDESTLDQALFQTRFRDCS